MIYPIGIILQSIKVYERGGDIELSCPKTEIKNRVPEI